MKPIFVVLLLTTLLSACAPAPAPVPTATTSPTAPPTPTDTPTPTETPTPTDTPTPIETPTPTDTPTPTETPTPTPTPSPTSRPTNTPNPTSTPVIGLCPVDPNLPGVVFDTDSYQPGRHNGYDFNAPHGTPLRSPGDCTISYFYIGPYSEHAVVLVCPEFNHPDLLRRAGIPQVTQIVFGHIDFCYGDTGEWYGIDPRIFCDENGNPRTDVRDVYGIRPQRNSKVPRGAPLHVYVGRTGSQVDHVHMGFWYMYSNGVWTDQIDPRIFLNCPQ